MFNKLASIFVDIEDSPQVPPQEKKEESAENETTAAAPAPASSPAPTNTPAPTTSVAPKPVFVPATVNEAMVELLSKAIEAANLEGFDYLEFRDALAAMASAPLSEQQKFQAVFATATTMGVTKDRLVEAIDHYQQVLDHQKAEFQAQVESMIAQEVTQREELKSAKEQEIAALSEQIQQAQAAIGEKQQEILALSNEINEQNLNIQQTASSFEATFNFVSGKLQEDKGKIQNYLAG
jgi:hypothetical protein